MLLIWVLQFTQLASFCSLSCCNFNFFLQTFISRLYLATDYLCGYFYSHPSLADICTYFTHTLAMTPTQGPHSKTKFYVFFTALTIPPLIFYCSNITILLLYRVVKLENKKPRAIANYPHLHSRGK